jgi:hypothetical protein
MKKSKFDRAATEPKDRKRDRDGWKAQREAARRAKGKRREVEAGEKA